MIMSLALLPEMDTFSSCCNDATSLLTTAGMPLLLAALPPPSLDLADEEEFWMVTLGTPAAIGRGEEREKEVWQGKYMLTVNTQYHSHMENLVEAIL